jgi:hypothetical protein
LIFCELGGKIDGALESNTVATITATNQEVERSSVNAQETVATRKMQLKSQKNG